MRRRPDPHEHPKPQHRKREPAPPVPTLGQIHDRCAWVWLYCNNYFCHHRAPAAVAPFVIRWGRHASSDVLRGRARCSRCGHKGAMTQHPGFVHGLLLPFPTEMRKSWPATH
jgi:hypothetical protein